MSHLLLPEALAEIEQAAIYYDQHGLGLGDEFVNEIEATIQRVILQPEAWSIYQHGTRHCLTNRFPYSVIYRTHPDFILIVAIAHLRREPGYWSQRVPST